MLSIVKDAAEKVGGYTRLAERLGVQRPTFWSWHRQVPANRVQIISQITGVPPHEIRPDVFAIPPTTKRKSA